MIEINIWKNILDIEKNFIKDLNFFVGHPVHFVIKTIKIWQKESESDTKGKNCGE